MPPRRLNVSSLRPQIPVGAAILAPLLALAGCFIQFNPGHVEFRPHARAHAAVEPAPNPHLPDRILELGKRAESAGRQVDVVFLGDSLIQFWEKQGAQVWDRTYGDRALNLGCGWDQTQHVLWRLELGHLDRLAPKVVVLQVGTNNTRYGLHGPREIADGVAAILDKIRSVQPRTTVLLLGILPRGRNPDDPWRKNNELTNNLLKGLADGQRVRFVDLTDAFVDVDGSIPIEIMYDGVHLTELGYQRWAEAMAPALSAALGS